MPDGERVSVIVPAYDSAETIGLAVESILAQTVPAFEVIVVDDGTPDPLALDRALAPHAHRLHLIRQANAGVSAARNAALRVARGEYVAFLDGDDVWEPAFLAEQLAALRRAGADMVWSDGVYFGAPYIEGERVSDFNGTRTPVTIESLLSLDSVVVTSSVVARRELILDAGAFDESLTHAEDFDLWLRVVRSGSIVYNPVPLVRKRVRAESLSADLQRLYTAQVRIYSSYAESSDVSPRARELASAQIERARAQIELDAAKRLFLAGDFREAARRLRAANRTFRRPRLTAIHIGLLTVPRLLRWAYVRRRGPMIR